MTRSIESYSCCINCRREDHMIEKRHWYMSGVMLRSTPATMGTRFFRCSPRGWSISWLLPPMNRRTFACRFGLDCLAADMDYSGRGRLTPPAFISCVAAAAAGLVFGYDIGVTDTVAAVDSFSKTFLPSSVTNGPYKHRATTEDDYCKHSSKQWLQLPLSSLYLAALVASLCASSVTRSFGRRWSMFTGGVTFLSGTIAATAAQGLPTLIFGRILLGIGLGFLLQSVPVYISEIAPARLRGVLNVSFQLMVTIGILCGYLVMFATRRMNTSWAWRLGIAAAAIPSSIVTLSSLFLPDTPNSLINRDSHEEARSLLRRIRGTEDVSDEYNHLVAAGERCKTTERPWRNIVKRKYRGPLVMSILVAIFQQLAGLHAIVFYAPVVLRTLAIGGDSTRMVDMILGVFNVAATVVCFLDVDRLGRRKLFLQGGSQMIFCLAMVGTMLAIKYRSGESLDSISQTYAGFVLLFICLFVSAYAYSWGPLGWLVPSEIFPLEVRPAGQSIAVSVNMLCTFTVSQAVPTMLCRIKYALFFSFAGWVLVMTAVVMLFLPETKNVPIEEMMLVWKDHWFWGKFIADEDVRIGSGSAEAELTFTS